MSFTERSFGLLQILPTASPHWQFASRYGFLFTPLSGFPVDRMQMIFFSGFMMWAFSWKEYQVGRGEGHTSIWRPLWDSINLCKSLPSQSLFYHILTLASGATAGDFALEIGSELSYFVRRLTGRRSSAPTTDKTDLGRAFGVEGYSPIRGGQRRGAYPSSVPRMSYDDHIRLTPYTGSMSRAGAGLPAHAEKLGGSPRIA